MRKNDLKKMLFAALSVAMMGGCAANGTTGPGVDATTMKSSSAGMVTGDGVMTFKIEGMQITTEAGRNVTGKVTSFNYGPRGEVAGLVLAMDGKMAQLNFPPELGSAVKNSVNIGDTVKAEVRTGREEPRWGMGMGRPGMGGPEGRKPGMGPMGMGGPEGRRPGVGPMGMGGRDGRGPGPMRADHAVYEMVSLTDAKGKTYSMPRPEERKAVHVVGKVTALNYDRQGMVDGAQLDSGALVRFGPEEAKVLRLSAGSKVTVDGIAEPGLSGVQSIDAHTVNGILVKALGGERREGGPEARDRGPMDGRRGWEGPGRGGEKDARPEMKKRGPDGAKHGHDDDDEDGPKGGKGKSRDNAPQSRT